MSNHHYIDDGQSLPFFIRGVKGIFPDLRGERRPTLTRERNAAERDASLKSTAADKLAVFFKLAKRKLVAWDATNQKGEALPINDDSLEHLPPALWDKLLDILMGFSAGDLPEDATPAQRDELDDAFAAVERGEVVAVGDALVEGGLKN